MAKERGLGRGLGSLLGIIDDEEELRPTKREVKEETTAPVREEQKMIVPEGEVVREIEIGLIDNNPNQPRKNFDPNALNELSQSIKLHGIFQPILVTPKNGRYMIVAGERRFRACKLAGKKTIPCIVKELKEGEIKEIALLENIQRQDLNPIEIGRAMQELMNVYGWTQEQLADRLGKSRSAVANAMRLLTLSPAVIELIEQGKLSAGHARSLVVVTNPDVQLKLAEQVMSSKLTVRDMENAVKELSKNAKRTIKPKTQELSMEMQEFVDIMEKKFSTKINIKGNEKKGKIVINYYNSDDLDRIYEIIARLN
ncbi:MAG: ParB/RepB/Spo0J family partition protein [Clostridiales bacterium]|nr:ParB/RepB/Spo0J family partition protein [Clostridiales bacterium]